MEPFIAFYDGASGFSEPNHSTSSFRSSVTHQTALQHSTNLMKSTIKRIQITRSLKSQIFSLPICWSFNPRIYVSRRFVLRSAEISESWRCIKSKITGRRFVHNTTGIGGALHALCHAHFTLQLRVENVATRRPFKNRWRANNASSMEALFAG